MALETKVRPLAGTMSPCGYIRTESVASAVARNAMAGGFNDGCADSSFFGWNEPTLLDNAERGLGTRRGEYCALWGRLGCYKIATNRVHPIRRQPHGSLFRYFQNRFD